MKYEFKVAIDFNGSGGIVPSLAEIYINEALGGWGRKYVPDDVFHPDNFNTIESKFIKRVASQTIPRTFLVATTGLEWQITPTKTRINWKAATSLAAKYEGGWHIPSIVELATLIDYAKSEPCCVDQVKCSGGSYWTATSFADEAAYKWTVDFTTGHTREFHVTDNAYLRLVRVYN